MQHLERAFDGRNQFWRYLLMTLAAFIGGQLIGAIPLLIVVLGKIAHSRTGAIDSNVLDDLTRLGISRNAGLVLMMLPFVCSLLAMLFLLKPLHRRSPAAVINGTGTIRWGRFFFGAGVWGGLQMVLFGVSYALNPRNFVFHFDAASFLPLLLISTLLIPLQTSFEELYFRGYLAQGIGAGTRSRWAAIVIPGVAFGLIHVMNPEVKAYGLLLALPQYILIGLLFGFVATLDDGIECPMGAHAINNIFACTVVTFKDSALQTDALFRQQTVYPVWDLGLFVLIAIVFVYLLHRRYHWDFSVLRKKLQPAGIPGPI